MILYRKTQTCENNFENPLEKCDCRVYDVRFLRESDSKMTQIQKILVHEMVGFLPKMSENQWFQTMVNISLKARWHTWESPDFEKNLSDISDVTARSAVAKWVQAWDFEQEISFGAKHADIGRIGFKI